MSALPLRSVRRIWPPEPEPERPLVRSQAQSLHDWCLRFEVTLADEQAAYRFAAHYRTRFPSSAATSSGETAWVTFRTGATDEHDAGVLAAMTIKIVSDLPLVKAAPTGARVHYADDLGEVPIPEVNKRRAERAALLQYAQAIGAAPVDPDAVAPPPEADKPAGRARWIGPGGGAS